MEKPFKPLSEHWVTLLCSAVLLIIPGCTEQKPQPKPEPQPQAVIPIQWVRIPKGPVEHGSTKKVIQVDHDFEIMKYEVTNGQYLDYLRQALAAHEISVGYDGKLPEVRGYYPGDEFWPAGFYNFLELDLPETRSNKYATIAYINNDFVLVPDSSYLDHPVVKVTWFGAWAFAQKYGWSLPTVLEWERAARGHSSTRYPWGDSITVADASYSDEKDSIEGRSRPVDFYNGMNREGLQTNDRSQPFGVYGMIGNASEWTSTFVRDEMVDFAKEYPEVAGRRIFKGLGWGFQSDLWQGIDVNKFYHPFLGSYDLGFRCTRRITPFNEKGESSLTIRGKIIHVGDLADEIFRIVRPSDLVSQVISDDPERPNGKIITKHYTVGAQHFALVFTRWKDPGPYRLKSINIRGNDAFTTSTLQTPVSQAETSPAFLAPESSDARAYRILSEQKSLAQDVQDKAVQLIQEERYPEVKSLYQQRWSKVSSLRSLIRKDNALTTEDRFRIDDALRTEQESITRILSQYNSLLEN